MALRDSKLFRGFAYTMAGLAIASFVLRILLQVETGNGANVYHGGRGLPIPYIVILVTISALAIVGIIWLCLLAWRRWRHVSVRENDV
jgi:hypothetical protein